MSAVQDELWVEKYRPEELDEVIGHEDVTERMEAYLESDGVPHMLFSGPPGSGKTALVTAFARERFGEGWRDNFVEFNASDERGIDTVREKIKTVARRSPANEEPYKMLFLDEADKLTRSAQPALRRIIEDYSDITRFFLSCNYLNDIIEPIQSRCTPFRVGGLSDADIEALLRRVSDAEGLEVEEGSLGMLASASRGDARKAVNTLQTSALDGEVRSSGVESIIGTVDDAEIESIVDSAINGEMEEAFDALDREYLKQGIAPQEITEGFLRVVKRKDIPEPGLMKIAEKLAECEWRLQHGCSPNVQYHSLLCDIRVGYFMSMGEKYG